MYFLYIYGLLPLSVKMYANLQRYTTNAHSPSYEQKTAEQRSKSLATPCSWTCRWQTGDILQTLLLKYHVGKSSHIDP